MILQCYESGKKEKKILEWVSPYDPSQKHHEIAARLRQPNTGQVSHLSTPMRFFAKALLRLLESILTGWFVVVRGFR
jgi:hypothetical protein